MTRGHVERLAPMVAEALAAAGVNASDLDGIAVTTGPGSFTGARLGIAFARGLSLSAGVPVTGLSVFEVMAADTSGSTIVTMPGKNGALMLQGFSDGHALGKPQEYPPDQIAEALPQGPFRVIGPATDALFAALPSDAQDRAHRQDWTAITAEDIARCALPAFAEKRTILPAPLYLRPPDAKPQVSAAKRP